MAYIGRPLQVANLAVQSGTGDGSDTTPIATLDYATTTNGIAVYLDGVRQLAGTDFNVTAQTTLTFTTAPANGVGVDVYFLGLELSLPTPADGTVATAKIADDAVTLAKMAPGTDGNIISYDTSGNPVAVATGSSGQVLTSAGAGAPPTFATASSVSEASQAEQEAASATDKFVSPAKQHFHDSAPKAWLNFNGSGTIAIRDSYNITSIEDNGVSDYTINIATNMSSANYAAVGSCSGLDGSGDATFLNTNRVASSGGVADQSAGAIRIGCTDQAGVTIDSKYVSVAFFGDI